MQNLSVLLLFYKTLLFVGIILLITNTSDSEKDFK